MEIYDTLKRLVKVLAQPDKEIVGRFWITDDIFANSIEIDDNDDVIFNIWVDYDLELQIGMEELSDEHLEKIIHLLKTILLN